MINGWPVGTGGDLESPNTRMFLRMLVTERSLHLATFAICEMASLFLLSVI